METDVTKAIDETMDEGRYRGFDLDEEIEIDFDDENETEETTSEIGNNGKIDTATTLSFLQRRIKNQKKTITNLQKTDKVEPRKEVTWENETWITEITALKRTIDEQKETIEKLRDELAKKTDNVNDGNDTKKRKRNDEIGDTLNMTMIADSFEKDQKIKELTEEIQQLKQQQARKLTIQPTVDKSTEAKATRILPSNNNTPLPNMLTEMEKLIEKKFNNLETTISNIVEKKLNEKQDASSDEVKVSFAEMLSKNIEQKNSTVEKAIKATQNYERVMETERGKREKNIVMHGVIANEPDREAEFDQEYVASFLQVIGADVSPESITRLGKNVSDPTENRKSRPLRLCMKTIEDKEKVMRRLSNLKNADDKYKKVSVKDDYTFEEREIIKEWQAMADTKNQEENTKNWKCRGNPKNGMRLVKIKTRENTIQTMETNA